MTLRTIATRWPITIGVHETLAAGLDRLRFDGFRHLPVVTRDGKVAGMLSDRDAMLAVGWHRGRNQPRIVREAARQRRVGEFMSTPAVSLPGHADLAEACRVMLTHRISSVVLQEEGRLQGLVTTADLFEAYARLGAPGSHAATIADVMQPEVFTAPPTTSLADLIRLMEAERIRHIPILQNKRLIGMLSDRDILWVFGRMLLATPEEQQAMTSLQADDVMSRHIGTVAATAPILLAAVRMVAHQISALPVMKAGEMVGIVTATDLLTVMHAAFSGGTIAHLSTEDGTTSGAVEA